jgi:hypothetical protein
VPTLEHKDNSHLTSCSWSDVLLHTTLAGDFLKKWFQEKLQKSLIMLWRRQIDLSNQLTEEKPPSSSSSR